MHSTDSTVKRKHIIVVLQQKKIERKNIPKERKKSKLTIFCNIFLKKKKNYFLKASKCSLYQEIYLVDFVFDTSTTTRGDFT